MEVLNTTCSFVFLSKLAIGTAGQDDCRIVGTIRNDGSMTMEIKNNFTLRHKSIGDIRGRFFVPDYQRGYRWDANDVTRLLNDIWDSDGQEYSLQPIVVKLHQDGPDDASREWELIDGQQRLTTLFVLMRYMERHANCGIGAPYTLRYDTRPGSEAYLHSLEESLHETNIDFYHLFRAHRCIDDWFQRQGDKFAQNSAANTVHGYLFKTVRVIWYEAPATTPATALFTRLNVGRIPLTDAELIKAALLSTARDRSNDRAHEIAAQWDGIERDLHLPDIWAFVAGLATDDGDERYPTRISLLLDTLADATAQPLGKRPRYYTFDTLRSELDNDPSIFWKKVVALHAQILGWAEQPVIYNKIGFLIASGDSFGELARVANGKRKSEFERFLVDRIRDRVRVRDDDLEELNYEEKKRGYPKLLEILLLMNVETTTQSGLRFPFVRHVGEKWSLEHIHAQNAELLNRAEQWRIWLIHHKSALEALTVQSNADEIPSLKVEIDEAIASIDAGKAGNFSGERFNSLSARILKMLDQDNGTDHTIRNLALLSSRDNSRLSNSVFEVKRQMILELDRRGDYVPVCTRNIFLKYYANADAQQPHFWSAADKASYLAEIRNRLQHYLIDFGKGEVPEQ